MHIRQTYRIYPTTKQAEIFSQWLGCARKVWNLFLAKNIKKYENEKVFIFSDDMQLELTQIKKDADLSYLKQCPSQALQQKCQDLDTALNRAIKHTSGFPKFKARKKDKSGIRFPQSWKIENNKLYLPKLKTGVKIVEHRQIQGKPTSLTLSRDKAGDFWVSIVYNTYDNYCQSPITEINTAVGIDVGIKEFAITSNGEIFKNNNYFRKNEKKIAKLNKSHSRKQKESNNKEKARIKLAREHRKISNKRDDFSKQTASSIAKNNDLVCVENLNIKGMMQNHKLAKSIADVGWGQFVSQLEWQCLKRGKHFIKIGRFFASTKTCSCCGEIQEMSLNNRIYDCQSCGLYIDRDLNAAINIVNEGTRIYNTAGTAEIYACGDTDDVSCPAQEA